MAAYSMDLRLRVLRDADAGLPSDELAEKYSVSRAWVDRLKQRRRETGEVAPRKQTRWRPQVLHAQLTELAALIRERPDRTLAELQEALRTPASLPTLCRTIKRLGFRFKKTVHASEHDRADVRRARTVWRAAAPTLDPARLVCLDESGVRTDLIRRYGRGLSGARVPDHTPDGRWHTTTFLGALRVTGLTAPAVFDGQHPLSEALRRPRDLQRPDRRPPLPWGPHLRCLTSGNGALLTHRGFNVFLIDGVDINDNLFGYSNDLFIEEAIEEAQILTGGISAEYGRFSGGVINVVTKSGGNDFSGSFRVNMNKPDWVQRTPFEVEQGNERTGTLANNSTYETTVGGPIVLDRLWFFYANRIQRETQQETFGQTGIAYEDKTDNACNQIKFTGTPAQGHTLEGSYMRNSTSRVQPTFGFTIDPAGIINPTLPNDLWVATYRGAATPNLFTEFQVSKRRWGRRGVGGTSTAIVDSPFLTLTQAFSHYNAPYFDANDPEDRNNRQFTGSGTYFLPTELGTHSVKGGFEHFQSTRVGGNQQSATENVYVADYAENADGSPLLDGGRLVPVFVPGDTILLNYVAVRNATIDINTLSFYVNDTWSVNDHLTLNLGVRAETVDSEATGNIAGVDHGTIVPRLAVAFDPRGDGRYTIQSSYSHYSGNYNVTQFADNTNVGNPDELVGIYTGPAGRGRDFGPGFSPDNYVTVAGDFPTRNVFFDDDDVHSPITKEFTFSAGAGFGPSGYAKVTYINRRASKFVEDFLDLTTGSTEIVENGRSFGTFTNKLFKNTDLLTRDYDAVEVQTRLQVTDDFLIDGTYTVQIQNDGNFEGEARNQPASSSPAFDFPEITPEARYFPIGRLDEFQRHKLRIWGLYNIGMERFGDLDIGGIWRVNSGRTYSFESSNTRPSATQADILDDLEYASSPARRTLYYSDGRGSGSFAGYGLFDLSLNYNVPVWESLSPWIKAEIFNLFGNDKLISWNTTVVPDTDGPVDALGIPTNFIEGGRFGEATSPDNYPQYLPNLDGLRAFQLAFGLRF